MKSKILPASEFRTIDEPVDAVKLIRQRADSEKNGDDDLYICNISDIIDKYHVWKQHLPRVKPFYGERERYNRLGNTTTRPTTIDADYYFVCAPFCLPFCRVLAVKCNNSPAVLGTLAALGTGFDCASKCKCPEKISKEMTFL